MKPSLQESIQGFSGWCIKNRKSAYKMARCWIKVIKKVRSFLMVSIMIQICRFGLNRS